MKAMKAKVKAMKAMAKITFVASQRTLNKIACHAQYVMEWSGRRGVLRYIAECNRRGHCVDPSRTNCMRRP